MIEFYIVDLIISLSLESFEDDCVLFTSNLELHCVKNRAEASVSNKTTLALVFVLEEWLNQESLVAYIPSKSLKASIEYLLLLGFKQMFGI